jgi:hypothetical protein
MSIKDYNMYKSWGNVQQSALPFGTTCKAVETLKFNQDRIHTMWHMAKIPIFPMTTGNNSLNMVYGALIRVVIQFRPLLKGNANTGRWNASFVHWSYTSWTGDCSFSQGGASCNWECSKNFVVSLEDIEVCTEITLTDRCNRKFGSVLQE